MDAALLGEVLDSIGDALVVVDGSWRYLFLNRRAKQMLGKPASYLLGRRMDEEYPDVAGWPQYRRAMTERVTVSFESYAEMANAWVEVHVAPSLDGISLVVSDITDRKRDQEAVREGTQRLRAVVDSLPVGVTIFDATGQLIEMNAAYRSIWRADEGDVPRTEAEFRALKAFDPETGELLDSSQYPGALVLTTRQPVIGRLYAVERFDGTRGVNSVSAVPLRDESGEMNGFVVVTQDITASWAEQRLYRSLAEFTTAITSSFDTGVILDAVVTKGAAALGAVGGLVLALVDEGWVVSAASERLSGRLGTRFEIEEPAAAVSAIGSGRPLVVPASQAASVRVVDDPSEPVGSAYIVIPLVHVGMATGAIVYAYPRGSAEPTDVHLRYAERIQLGATLALENARRFESERAALRDTESSLEVTRRLLTVADALAAPLALGEVLEIVCRAALATLHRERVTISLYDEESGAIEVVGSQGVDPIPIGMRVSVDELSLPARQALAEGRTHQIDYDRIEPYDAGVGRTVGSHIALDVPLVFQERVLGLLAVDDPSTGREFDEREREILEGIASQAAAAIENARLFATQQTEVRLAAALSRVESSIHGTLERDEMLRRIAEESAEGLGADGTVLCLREGDRWVVRHAYGMSEPLAGARFTDDESPILAAAAQTAEVVVVGDVTAGAHTVCARQQKLGVRAVAMAPLVDRDVVVGALLLDFRDVRHFTPPEVRYVERLSSAVGLAIANVRLYEAEHHIADRLQGALLTVPETLPGVTFATAYRAAAEAARVGGDFYDAFAIDERRVALAIGDVAGKGLGAAVLTSLVKHTLRAYAVERPHSTAEILEAANHAVWRFTAPEAFVTVFFGILDLGDRTFLYSNAGHTTVAVVHGNGEVTPLTTTGPLVGGYERVPIGERRVAVGVGDTLFFYTDGLTEARLDRITGAEERLFAQLGEWAGSAPAELVERVIDGVLESTSGRLRDDIALLAVRLDAVEDEPRA